MGENVDIAQVWECCYQALVPLTRWRIVEKKSKEIWNVCMNELYLIQQIIALSPVDQEVDGKPRRSRICTSKIA